MLVGDDRDRSWVALIEGEIARRALEVAKEVAKRLRSRERLLAASRTALGQTRYPRTVYWEPYGIAQGDAGIALACSYLDACFPSEGWDVVGHEYLTWAVKAADEVGSPPLGLFGGLAGLAFAAWSLSRGGTRYRGLLDTVDVNLNARILVEARSLIGRHGCGVSEFDLITGVCGVGVYFLYRGFDPPRDVGLRAILQTIVALTETTGGVPHWYTPAHLVADESLAKLYPMGNLNCGLAHGIPGPMALMALAYEGGVRVDGLKTALVHTAEWIAQHRVFDAFGVNWPTTVPFSPDRTVSPESLDSSRAAWCYGTPGVARALWLAGRALDRDDLCQLAIEGMSAVYRRPTPERRIDSPTFCHGVAGLLQVTVRFAHDTGLSLFRDAGTSLCEQLLSLYEPDRALGFASIEPAGNFVDQPGLLDGAAGVVLAMLAATTDVRPAWDRLFLLS
jgi:lantibiotic biosynthesis protein